jgi:hypothetical protein
MMLKLLTLLMKLLPGKLNDFLRFPTPPDPTHFTMAWLHCVLLCHAPSVNQPRCSNSLHDHVHGANGAG